MNKIKVLVTAGSTKVKIDQVRCLSANHITNIFRGRTGSHIAEFLNYKGHNVTIATSNSELIKTNSIRVLEYRTYDDLKQLMEKEIKEGSFDVIIHAAAVSDFKVNMACVVNPDFYDFMEIIRKRIDSIRKRESNKYYHEMLNAYEKIEGKEIFIEVKKDDKISSKFNKLFFQLSNTEKIVDKIKKEWNFTGMLFKFKLEVGISEEILIKRALESKKESEADVIIANTLEEFNKFVYIIDCDNSIKKIEKRDLYSKIYENIQKFYALDYGESPSNIEKRIKKIISQ